MTPSVVAWIASVWVWAITSVMPPELRDRQRAERSAHLRDHIEEGSVAGQPPLRIASGLALGLVAGMPADLVFAIGSARFMNADPNEEGRVNWKLLIGLIGAVAVIAVVVVAVQGPERVRQNGHLPWVRWLRGVGGLVMLAASARALVRQRVSPGRKSGVLYGVIVCVLIGAYLVRLGLSPG